MSPKFKLGIKLGFQQVRGAREKNAVKVST